MSVHLLEWIPGKIDLLRIGKISNAEFVIDAGDQNRVCCWRISDGICHVLVLRVPVFVDIMQRAAGRQILNHMNEIYRMLKKANYSYRKRLVSVGRLGDKACSNRVGEAYGNQTVLVKLKLRRESLPGAHGSRGANGDDVIHVTIGEI